MPPAPQPLPLAEIRTLLRLRDTPHTGPADPRESAFPPRFQPADHLVHAAARDLPPVLRGAVEDGAADSPSGQVCLLNILTGREGMWPNLPPVTGAGGRVRCPTASNDGTVLVPVDTLIDALGARGHTEAAAAWAVDRHAREGTLTIDLVGAADTDLVQTLRDFYAADRTRADPPDPESWLDRLMSIWFLASVRPTPRMQAYWTDWLAPPESKTGPPSGLNFGGEGTPGLTSAGRVDAPAPTTTDGLHGSRRLAVELGDPGERPRVMGVDVPALSQNEYAVVRLLLDAHPSPIPSALIPSRTRIHHPAGKEVRDPGRTLRELVKKDARWGRVLRLPGQGPHRKKADYGIYKFAEEVLAAERGP